MSRHDFWSKIYSSFLDCYHLPEEAKIPLLVQKDPAGLSISPAEALMPGERRTSFRAWRHPLAAAQALCHMSWCRGLPGFRLCLPGLRWPWLTPKALCRTGQTSLTAPGRVSGIHTSDPWAQKTWQHPSRSPSMGRRHQPSVPT